MFIKQPAMKSTLTGFLVCVAQLLSFAQTDSPVVPTELPKIKAPSVWVIRSVETKRKKETRWLFKQLMGPTVGATVSCYGQGVAEIVLKGGASSVGFVFEDESNGAISFWFNERVGDLDQLVLLRGRFRGAGTLVFSDESDTIRLKKVGRGLENLSQALRKKAEDRKALTLAGLLQMEKTKTGSTSSDGKASLPGVQGGIPASENVPADGKAQERVPKR